VVLELIQEAGNPYFDWLFGSSERSAGVLASWARRSSSEVSTEQVTVAISGGELVGMFIGLSGSAVQRSRKADAFALFGEVGNDPAQRSALLQKLKETKNLFVAVESSEYYLSKIGVVPACRGRGFGKALMSEFLAAGRRSGFYRFRLDVSADNERAIRMYRSFGFVIDSCHFAAGMRYLSMTLSDSPPGGTVRMLPSYLAEPVRFERLISASDRQFPT
jgi:ribosomal protein S18 acetylase RimI-like enzyme